MVCKHCGKELEDGLEFCIFCGKSLTEEVVSAPSPKPKKTKLITAICGGVGAVGVAAVLIVNGITGSDSYKAKQETKAQTKVLEQFVEDINEGNAEKAFSVLTFTKQPLENPSFSSFANEHLTNASFEIGDTNKEDGTTAITVTSDTDTFSLKMVKNNGRYRISADDFLMSYKVHYASNLSSYNNSFLRNETYIGNGINQYEVYTYKDDTTTVNHTMLFGDDAIVPNIKTVVAFDENYQPSEIVSVTNYLDDEQSFPSYVVLKDGVIFIDTYGITEEYSQILAYKFKNMFEDMVNYAVNGKSYEDFCELRTSIVPESESLKKWFNDWVEAGDLLYNGEYEVTADTWTYDKYWHLGEQYIMCIDTSVSYGSSGGDQNVEMYVGFVADGEDFKINALGSTRAEVMSGGSASGDEDNSDKELPDKELEVWQIVYREVLEQFGDNAQYALVHINNDDIPEIIMFSPNSKVIVFSYTKKGEGSWDPIELASSNLEDGFEGYAEREGLFGIRTEDTETGKTVFREYYFDSETAELVREYGASDSEVSDIVADYKYPALLTYEEVMHILKTKYVAPETDAEGTKPTRPDTELLDWQNAYCELIDEWITYEDCDFECALVYIDDDDIPELVTVWSPIDYTLHTFVNGELVEIRVDGYFDGYVEREGLFGGNAIRFDVSDTWFSEQRLENGVTTQTKYHHADIIDYNKVQFDTGWDCYVNDESVTKTEYDVAVQSVIDAYDKPDYMTYDEMRTILTSEYTAPEFDNSDNTAEKPAWKTAYLDVIEQYNTAEYKSMNYYLYYIDDNDIPELYIDGYAYGVGNNLYTYADNEVKTIIEGGSLLKMSRSQFIERSNQFWVCDSGSQVWGYSQYELKNGEITLLDQIEFYSAGGEYRIDGEIVSEADYVSKVEEYRQLANPDSSEGQPYTYDELYAMLTN